LTEEKIIVWSGVGGWRSDKGTEKRWKKSRLLLKESQRGKVG